MKNLKAFFITCAIFLVILVVLVALFVAMWYFGAGAPHQEHPVWGVNFSKLQADKLKLDWKATYLAILEDLGAKQIKLLLSATTR